MAQTKEKKSFKKFAKKHLATVIQTRRKTAVSKKEKKERIERKKIRKEKNAIQEEREHVEHLERLKDTDPEFYSYLETEDPTLLEFDKEDLDVVSNGNESDADTELDEEDEERKEEGALSDDEDEKEGDNEYSDEGKKKKEWGEDLSRRRISQKELEKLVSHPNVERCIDIFVSALRELGFSGKEKVKASTTRKFEEPNLVKQSLLQMGQVLGKNAAMLISGKGALKSPRTRYLLKRFLNAIVVAITESGKGNTDISLVVGLLQSLLSFVPLLHFVKSMTKSVLKTALTLCMAEEEAVRVSAYVVVRTIATRATGTRSMYQSTAFKGVFLTLVRTSFHYNVHTRPIIAFLINCVVDLYGTDVEAAYQHTFVYLRQLAIYLRAALQQQTASNVRAVANWQFVTALRTWGAVVSTYSDPSQLGPLIHPVVQIATGMMDLFSSPRLFPLHLQVIEVLNHIASRSESGTYIPVAPYLLRILSSPSVSLSSRGANSNGGAGGNPYDTTDELDLPFTLRVKKTQAKSIVYHRALWNQTLYLLTEHLATHAHTIGFPEAFWAVERTLKQLKKEVTVPQVHATLARLAQLLSSNAQRIRSRRDAVNFGPCDLAAVKQFEDQLKYAAEKGGEQCGLVAYFATLRQQRVQQFASQLKGSDQSRLTLEKTVEKELKRKKIEQGKKRKRSSSSDMLDSELSGKKAKK